MVARDSVFVVFLVYLYFDVNSFLISKGKGNRCHRCVKEVGHVWLTGRVDTCRPAYVCCNVLYTVLCTCKCA